MSEGIFGDRPLYGLLRLAFSTASRVFYASYDVRGLENVPSDGEATILCFNHGNSLADSIVLITNTPRTIRFCAKNTLWSMPVISNMIKMSGAVPVFRRQDHGDKAAEFNVDTFRAVYKALDEGDCVGFSPEGVSSFRSYATKFKNGVAHIALEAVERAVKRGDDDFKVKILPAVMAFTHREKFRSDVLIRFRPPVIVDKSWAERVERGDRKVVANELISLVEKEFHENIISAPNWKIIKYAITATRIQRPMGTYMSLSTYMYLLRGWVEVFKLDMDTVVVTNKGDKPGDQMTLSQVWNSLETYQTLLDTVRIKDERFRRIEHSNNQRPSISTCLRIIAYRATVCMVLFIIACPGLLFWSPAWYIIKRKERALLDKGAGWVDSVAENKMLLGFAILVVITLFANFSAPLLLGYLWLTMRLYEEAVASARSICGIYLLMKLPQDKLDTILKARLDAKRDILLASKMFPQSSADRILEESGDDIYEDKTDQETETHPWWHNFNPMRRRKKDWNELLRLSDYCTMDYV
mmetsp:Transcript_22324/g.39569  ORF Transcript_22324/g.39569 Transcript_22324/m.39569 type:complete len:525 (+) Transcript_22324:76-1650(+)